MRRAEKSQKIRTQRAQTWEYPNGIAHQNARFKKSLSRMSKSNKRAKHGRTGNKIKRRLVSDDDAELAEIMADMEPEMRVQTLPDLQENVATPSENTTNDAWCFTWNNYTEEEEAYMRAFHMICKQVKFLCIGKEIGAKGTPHLQGMIVFTNRKKYKTVRTLLNDRGTN